MQIDPNNLIRKQFLVTRKQAEKLEKLASSSGVSAAEVLRRAIDAYTPESLKTGMQAPELIEFAYSRMKEAMEATKAASLAVECLTEEKQANQ